MPQLKTFFTTIFILVIHELKWKCIKADVGLPLIQISHDVLGEDYPEMREEVRLEDFFWTGSGDGPPDYLKKVHTSISKGKEVIVKTETVVATVYVDGNNEVDIPLCLDCVPDDGGGGGGWDLNGVPPLNYTATDRRYWLLTVLSGFYTQQDNSQLEEKLARLYRLAFTRQQSRHLGINGAQVSGIAVSTGRQPGRGSTTERTLDSDVEIMDMMINTTPFNRRSIEVPYNTKSEWASSSEEDEEESIDSYSSTTEESSVTTTDPSSDMTTDSSAMTLVPWELIQKSGPSEKEESASIIKSPPTVVQPAQVRVVIHNITQITEEEVQKGVVGSAADNDFNGKIDDRPVANQTELIYSVFVSGRPVLAVAAANDMRLVSEAEVSATLGNKGVFMKAEPYLREPQATPLAPATRSGSVAVIDSIQKNPALVVVTSIAILLLLLLLLALVLMGRSRMHAQNREVNRASSRNELISESQSGRADTGRTTAHSHDVGVQNIAYENERREPRIHFPRPPDSASRRGSLTSSDNTSDSSVYSPINPPPVDVQRMLDYKASALFDHHKRQYNPYDRAETQEEAVYTSVVTEKKRDKARRKTKRRYLSENRVGSLEASPVQVKPSREITGEDSLDGDGLRPNYHSSERNEAYNRQNNYHRNKLIHQKSMYTDKDYANVDEEFAATEAINKEIIRALKPVERSSDTGSIGSFLSMASVKAFPKSALPEPLNRVLDPVFVTYYDNVENSTTATAMQKPSSAKSLKSPGKQMLRKSSAPSVATIDSFPSPKAPIKSSRQSSQSDNPDPGVLGPIVWERHKRGLSDSAPIDIVKFGRRKQQLEQFDHSPIHDPAIMRNHYEGLLEGALQMYSSQDDLPMPLPTKDFAHNRSRMRRENRGSSAGLTGYSAKLYSSDQRPATAQPKKSSRSNQSTQPPSPSSGAWGGSLNGSRSPIRPLSAGPLYQMGQSAVDTASPRESLKRHKNISAAPIIEAIQDELRKYK